jgi:8-oxo-dGTP pyrophosphatase MutT (NUDIX family)
MLIFHEIGNWSADQVQARSSSAASRPIVPEVESLIDRTWNDAVQRPGMHLFDGPMCRLESWRASLDRLDLELAPTTYRAFFGTNMRNPHLADRFGRAILANPLGVSPALLSRDGFLLLGRRNASVAYYPHRLHPFAGSVEPRDRVDVFADVARELNEELGFTLSDIADIRCTGLVEDVALRQPELIFAVRSTRTRDEIERQVDATEHGGSWSVPADPQSVASALRTSDEFTPVAIAALLLYGRAGFGEAWFSGQAHRFRA